MDIDGDGQLDVLPNGTKFAAWWEVSRSANGPTWIRHDLPDEVAGHGVGFGDIDGDQRGDLVSPNGWLAATSINAVAFTLGAGAYVAAGGKLYATADTIDVTLDHAMDAAVIEVAIWGWDCTAGANLPSGT